MEYERIVGEFEEINGQILEDELNSKLPKPLASFVGNINRKKLKKVLKKLRNSDYIMTKDNLYELFFHVFNNYPPFGSFNNIQSSMLLNEKNIVGVYIKSDSENNTKTVSKFTIYEQESQFHLEIMRERENGTVERIFVSSRTLYKPEVELNGIISEINNGIKNELCDFIDKQIDLYMVNPLNSFRRRR